jgi:hypothetical protein
MVPGCGMRWCPKDCPRRRMRHEMVPTDIPPKSPVSHCCTTLSSCTKTTACRIAISPLRVICGLPFSFRQTVL